MRTSEMGEKIGMQVDDLSALCIGCGGGGNLVRKRLRTPLEATMAATSPDLGTQGRNAMEREPATTRMKTCVVIHYCTSCA